MLTSNDLDWIPEGGYDDPLDARYAGMAYAKELSRSVELGGGVVNIGGGYYFTEPVGENLCCHFAANIQIPAGGSLDSLYHSHTNQGSSSIYFSPEDVNVAERVGVPSAVGNFYDHNIRVYNPATMSPDAFGRFPGGSRGTVICTRCF